MEFFVSVFSIIEIHFSSISCKFPEEGLLRAMALSSWPMLEMSSFRNTAEDFEMSGFQFWILLCCEGISAFVGISSSLWTVPIKPFS